MFATTTTTAPLKEECLSQYEYKEESPSLFEIKEELEDTIFLDSSSMEMTQEINYDGFSESTKKKCRWGVNLFKDWFSQYKSENNFPEKQMEELNKQELNYCLQYFLAAVRKSDGNKYPPRTLKEIICCIQYFYKMELALNFSILTDPEFIEVRTILKEQMKNFNENNKEKLIKTPKRMDLITNRMEDKLWENGILGDENARQLVNTMVFMMSLHLGLRACAEHRSLEYGSSSQLTLILHDDGTEELNYMERYVSKNKSIKPKCVAIKPNFHQPRKCLIRLYKKYISHRPETNGKMGCSAFYLTPLAVASSNVWYASRPFGIHAIEKVMRDIVKETGKDDGDFINNTHVEQNVQTRFISPEESVSSNKIARKEIVDQSVSPVVEDGYLLTVNIQSSISNLSNENPSCANYFNTSFQTVAAPNEDAKAKILIKNEVKSDVDGGVINIHWNGKESELLISFKPRFP